MSDCEAVILPFVSSPEQLIQAEGSTTGNTHGTTITVTCQSGYQLNGEAEITCTNGNWVPQVPVCELITEDEGLSEKTIVIICCVAVGIVVFVLLSILLWFYIVRRRRMKAKLMGTPYPMATYGLGGGPPLQTVIHTTDPSRGAYRDPTRHVFDNSPYPSDDYRPHSENSLTGLGDDRFQERINDRYYDRQAVATMDRYPDRYQPERRPEPRGAPHYDDDDDMSGKDTFMRSMASLLVNLGYMWKKNKKSRGAGFDEPEPLSMHRTAAVSDEHYYHGREGLAGVHTAPRPYTTNLPRISEVSTGRGEYAARTLQPGNPSRGYVEDITGSNTRSMPWYQQEYD